MTHRERDRETKWGYADCSYLNLNQTNRQIKSTEYCVQTRQQNKTEKTNGVKDGCDGEFKKDKRVKVVFIYIQGESKKVITYVQFLHKHIQS